MYVCICICICIKFSPTLCTRIHTHTKQKRYVALATILLLFDGFLAAENECHSSQINTFKE